MKKPVIFENRMDPNDLRNIHNPDKYAHTLGEYAQIDQKKAEAPKSAVKVSNTTKPEAKKEATKPEAKKDATKVEAKKEVAKPVAKKWGSCNPKEARWKQEKMTTIQMKKSQVARANQGLFKI